MKKKIICMIPARIGSQRFRHKNLALIQNKPILSWGIESAKDSNVFEEIIINGDNIVFEKIAKSYNLKYHDRNPSLSTNESKSDDVIFDFLKIYECDFIVWFNATSTFASKRRYCRFRKITYRREF